MIETMIVGKKIETKEKKMNMNVLIVTIDLNLINGTQESLLM